MWWGVGVVLVWTAALAPVDAATAKSDVSALGTLLTSLNSPSQLTNWNSSGGDPCGQSWKGVTCSGSNVTEVKLSGLGLSGHLGFALDRMISLTIFDLSNNNIGAGNPLPYALPPNVTRLDLSRNAFGGNLPYSISLMTNLKYLNVSHNKLQDGLSDMFGNLPKLSEMDISFNNHSGNLPQSFSALSNLTTLYLQDNNFTGSLNILVNLPLQNLNVANNRFTGGIPDKLKGIKNLESGGNSWNSESGPPSPTSSHSSPGGRKTNPNRSPVGNRSPSDKGGGSKSGIGGAVIAGIVVSALVVGSLVALFFIKSRKRKPPPEKLYKDNQLMPTAPSYENNDTMSFQMPSAVVLPATINLKPPPADRIKSFGDGDYLSKTPSAKNCSKAPTSATFYSVADLQVATRSFSIDNLLGEGTYGQVYKAQFDDGKVLAVKKINSSSLPANASEAFMEIVSSISRLQHQNLTNLVGYCSEHGQHLLVYEFHKNGSLHDFLHISDEYSKPLSWNGRVMIALGTARGLEYLHEVCLPSIMHKNFKSANILLDAELNPHISDSGLSDIVSDAEYQVFNLDIGSGYSAPEVVMTGQYTLKSDVYSFGIIMLELLTGRKPFDSSKPRNEQSLVRWATPQLHDIDALDKMVDPALKGLFPAKSLSRFADVVALCVQPEPEFRPPMSEVVRALVRLVQRASMSKKTGSIDEYEASLHSEDPSLNDILDDALGPR